MRDATGIQNVNITRITDNSAAANVTEMDASATNLSLSDATRGGAVTFSHKEEVLTGTSEVLNLATNNVRLNALTLNEAGDAVADTGFYFETVNYSSVGTNDLDAMTIAANTREDVVLGNAADTTKQRLEITAGAAAGATGSLEINTLNATGVDTMVIHANHRVDIALDKAAALANTNGLNATDLETLTIDGAANVRIDGVEGQVGALADTQGLTVNGSAMTGNLRIGVVGTTSVDDLFNLTSGIGNDEVRAFGSLGGDIVTDAGTDTVTVDANMTGTASVSTGAGNDTVTAVDMGATTTDKDLANNGGYDDVQAASITTGDDNDTVTVREMGRASDWDNITVTDGNLNDLQVVKGAQVTTGAGADSVTARNLLEGAKVDTGEGDDTFTVSLNDGTNTVFAADTNADVITLVTATQGTATGRTDEVNADGTVNRVGAELDMGAGTADVASFTETETITNAAGAIAESGVAAYTIVARDALVSGAETMNVTALDAVTVTVDTSMADQDANAAGTQTDINANVVGTQVANFTILNQIIDDNAANNIVSNTVLTASTVNDNLDTDGAITADVLRFDTALTNINLVSEEQIVQTGAATEVYQAGTATAFTLKNLREGVALSLTAHEATNNAATTVSDDTLLSIDVSANSATGLTAATYGNISNATNAAADVVMTLNYDASSETNDSAAISIGGTSTATNGAFDVLFALGAATTDTTDDAASATDDDTDRLENFTINVTDARTHSFDMGGFGDDDFGALAANGTNAAVTSLTVNTAGSSVQVDNVNTDTIRFNNAAGTAVTAANVTLRVDANNNYNITTGTGTDIIDMRADTVRAYNTATTAGADTINAGTGRDTLFVAGNNDMSSNDLNYGVVNVATVINDDVFANISGVEVLTIDSGISNAAAQDLTLDEAARTAGVDTVNLIDTDAVDNNQGINLVIGNNFAVAANTGDNANGELTAADAALVINASSHTANTTLSIENKDDDTDVAFVNMDVRMNALGGTILNFANTGDQNGTVEVRVATGNEDTVHTIGSAADGTDGGIGQGDSTGEVDINVTTGSFDKLVLVEGATSNDNSGAEGAMTIVIEADWTRGNGTAVQNTFELDASAVTDTDANTATGGATITVEDADTATLTIKGTQNDDNITGGSQNDTIFGNDGDDTIVGDQVVDNNELEVVTFAATYDVGDEITVTHNGNTATAVINNVGTTGANVAAAFADFLDGAYAGVNGITFTTAATTWASLATGGSAPAAAGDNLRLTGATAGTDYIVTATTNNAGDNTAQVQMLTITNASTADAETIGVVWNGVTYAIATADSNVVTATAGLATLSAAVTAAGGTLTTNIDGASTGARTVTITGASTGVAFPLITQVNIVDVGLNGVGTTGTLALTAGDLGTDQANPTVVTETVARTVTGAADTINGGAGNDTIAGLTGADVLDGGDGVDTLDYSLSLAAVNVNLATNVVSGGDAAGDTISNFEAVTGSNYNDTLTGSDAANTLTGGAGADTISGGAGADVIVAGEGSDVVDGGAGIDTITLTETISVQDTLVSDVIALANADIVTGFSSGTDKIDYNATLLNGLGTSADGIAGTDVITAADFATGLTDVNSTAGVVFINTTSVANVNANTQGTQFTAVLGSDATTLAANYALLEAQLIATDGALTGLTGLDAVLTAADSALVVLHDTTGTTGSIVLRIMNTDTTVANTLTGAEVELVGVFNGTQLAAADFI